MPIVEDYWRGVLLRLQGEVDVFSRLVGHAGERGRANELALANLLRPLVPARFGLGSGLVIDRGDRESRQTDIVIFERGDQPAALAQATHLLHPVETVLSAIEVKTTLQADDIDDCIGKREAIHALQPIRERVDGSRYPDFLLLAYASAVAPTTIQQRFGSSSQSPDLLCVLSRGLVGGRLIVESPQQNPCPLGHAMLRENGTDVAATVPGGERIETRGRNTYPVVQHDGKRYLGDPARCLLLFVEALIRRLSEQQDIDRPVMSDYLTPETRHITWLS